MTCFKKIDSLVNTGILTPASAAILHKVRTLEMQQHTRSKPHSDKRINEQAT